MRAGELRDYVEFQRNAPTRGASGEEIDNWSHHIFAWVKIRATAGEETITAHQLRMRFADIVHTDRVVFGSRIFDIVSVLDNQGMGRELVLELREDTSG